MRPELRSVSDADGDQHTVADADRDQHAHTVPDTVHDT